MSGDPSNEGELRRPLDTPSGERPWPALVILGGLTAIAALTLTVGPHPHARGQGLVLVLAACAPIILLRRWALPVLALAALATSVEFAWGTTSLPLGAMVGAAAYYVSTAHPRRSSVRAGIVAFAVVGAGICYSAMTLDNAPSAIEAVEGFLPLVAGWFVGDGVATRRRYQAGLVEQAERERLAELERSRQEVREERVRIARELHDVLAHTITVMTVQAGVGRRLMAKRPEEAATALESIEVVGRTAQDELQVVLGLLRDEEGQQASLVPTPRLIDLQELIGTVEASGTPVELRTSGTDRPLSPALELSIYRVVQEALTNVVKHAPGATATVDLEVEDDAIVIEIADSGRSAVATRPAAREQDSGPGHGIIGMRERVSAFGGSLLAAPLPGGGFHIVGHVPIDASP